MQGGQGGPVDIVMDRDAVLVRFPDVTVTQSVPEPDGTPEIIWPEPESTPNH